jgi:hypothetical protein
MVGQRYRRIKKMLPTTPVPSERRLALFEFVMKHPEVRVLGEGQRPKVPSWRKLLHLWNQQHPDGDEWHYPDPRNFSRDFGKAFDLIVNYYRNGKGNADVDREKGG